MPATNFRVYANSMWPLKKTKHMKKLSTAAILVLCILGSFSFTEPKEGKKRVLVVSFIEDNFYGDIYSKEEIAKANKIQKEDVVKLYDEMLSTIFTRLSDEETSYVQCPADLMITLREHVSFENKPENEKNRIIADVSNLSKEDFDRFLSKCDTDYVVFINAFRMAWIGEPYFKLENRIHYSVYSKEKENISSDVAVFSTPKLVPITKMEKKCSKTVGKMSNLFARLD